MPLYSKFGIPMDAGFGRNVTKQPKLKFKFRVRFINFGGLESATYNFDASQQLISVQRPTINFDATEIETYAGTIKVFNKPKFPPINIRFRDDMSNTFGAAAWSQLQKQFDFLNGRYAVSAGSAKFTTIIETLDGMNESRAVDAFVLEGCYINTSEFGDLNYSESAVAEVNLGIEYDYIGSYYSETAGGIDDPDYLMWYVTTAATSFATSEPINNSGEDVFKSFDRSSADDEGGGFLGGMFGG